MYDGPPADPPRLSVLVAAKDEEENIESCVRSMLSQDYPNFQLIAINDRSTDRTGQILDRVAAEDKRLIPVHVKELREGWFGKNNAMREGYARADGEWLCFIDADCRQTSTRTLTVAVRYAMENDVDFLSVLPRLETQSVWEQIIQPACGGLMVFWFNPSKVNDPAHPTAYANGAFMLMKRATYEAIGGHEPFKTEVNEDMHMARATKQAGHRLKVVQNLDLYVTRMYTNFKAIWRGWSRIFYGCFETFRRLRITLFVMLFSGLLPWYSAAAGWIVVGHRGWDAAGPWRWIALLATAAVLCQQSVCQ
jgi:glycosyltransferase involved in cell wall biosynthesis